MAMKRVVWPAIHLENSAQINLSATTSFTQGFRNGSRVVYEHHYDEQQNGGPLTSDDLSFDTANLP